VVALESKLLSRLRALLNRPASAHRIRCHGDYHMLIEKALYESRYELDNRPGWVRIPLRGLRRLLE
jgi:predicted trehalose synthase